MVDRPGMYGGPEWEDDDDSPFQPPGAPYSKKVGAESEAMKFKREAKKIQTASTKMAAQANMSQKIIRQNEKKLREIAGQNKELLDVIEQAVSGSAKERELIERLLDGKDLSKEGSDQLAAHLDGMNKVLSGLDAKMETNLVDVVDLLQTVADDTRLDQDDRKKSLERLQELVSDNKIVEQMSEKQLDAAIQLRDLNIKKMDLDKEGSAKVESILSGLRDETSKVVLQGRASQLAAKLKGSVVDEKEVHVGAMRDEAQRKKDAEILKRVPVLGTVLDKFEDVNKTLDKFAKINKQMVKDKFVKNWKAFTTGIKGTKSMLASFGPIAAKLGLAGVAIGVGAYAITKIADAMDKDQAEKQKKKEDTLTSKEAFTAVTAARRGLFGESMKQISAEESEAGTEAFKKVRDKGGDTKTALKAAKAAMYDKRRFSMASEGKTDKASVDKYKSDRDTDIDLTSFSEEADSLKFKKKSEDASIGTGAVATNAVGVSGYKGSSDAEAIKNFVKSKEGYAKEPYWDHAGVSIGYGHLLDGTKYLTQPPYAEKRGKSMVLTATGRAELDRLYPQYAKGIGKSEADALFEKDWPRYTGPVDAMLAKAKLDLPPQQKGALYSLAYNAGPGAVAKSGILEKLKAGDVSGAAKTLASTRIRASGEVSNALIKRRQDEVAIFTGGGAGAAGGQSISNIAGEPTAVRPAGSAATLPTASADMATSQAAASAKAAVTTAAVTTAAIQMPQVIAPPATPDRSTRIDDTGLHVVNTIMQES